MSAAGTRQGRIAIVALLSSVATVALATSLLLVGPAARPYGAIDATIPAVGGLEPVAVAALGLAVAVSGAVALIVLCEVTRQFAAASKRRRRLESRIAD